jgi:hypothetical protein
LGWTGARNGESLGVLVRIGNTLGGDMLFSGRKVNILHGGAIGGGVLRGVSKRHYVFFGHLLNLLLEDVENQAIVGMC